MKRWSAPSWTFSRWARGLLFAALGGALVFFVVRGNPPADRVQTLYLASGFPLKRTTITAVSGRRGRPYAPRSLELRSGGARFRACLIDISPRTGPRDPVGVFMRASAAIEAGKEPSSEGLLHQAVGVTHTRFALPNRFWGDSARYMLIVFCREETQVTVRTSYGR